MFGFWTVIKFDSHKDSQGFYTGVLAESKMDSGIQGFFYLPPHMRASQCGIKVGSEVWGILDDTTGIGVALYGVDCDFDYKTRADYAFTKTVTVDGAISGGDTITASKDISTTSGDVSAGVITLKGHVHTAQPGGGQTTTADPATP